MLARKTLLQNARIFKQARSLGSAGYRVTVVGVASPARTRVEHGVGLTVRRFSARGIFRKTALTRLLGFYLSAYRALSREVEPGQIIHCNDLDTLPLGLMLARGRDARIVYDAQDLYPDQSHIPWWAARVLRFVEKVLVRRVDRTIAVNDAIAQVMVRRYRVDVDSVVLNCPPFATLNGAGSGSVRDVLGIPRDTPILIYSGVLAHSRGLENTVMAMQELEGVSLVFLGGGPLQERLRSLAEDVGVARRVFFTDYVPHLEVPSFISSADVGIVPYERSGLNHYLCSPNKLFHYIMAELPVVCSDFPFLRQVVLGHGIGEVFDPTDRRSIARATRRALSHPDGASDRKQRLRTIKRRYCWEEEEKRFLAIYRSLER